jgi:hypothetical protein
MHRSQYNVERLRLYEYTFDRIITNDHSVDIAANLLVDIRWAEVSRAFVNSLCSRSAKGNIRPLAADFRDLISSAADRAFGTHQHAQIPSWFLQNNECFLASCLHKLIVHYTTSPHDEVVMGRAFGSLLDVADGLKSFLGLGHLASSTGAHALMSVVEHARYDFLKNEKENVCRPAMHFIGMMAKRILGESVGEMGVQSPFHYFARSARWQWFATRCTDDLCVNPTLSLLQHKVARHRARDDAARGRQAKKEQKQLPGILFLASSFLEAEAVEFATGAEDRVTTRKPNLAARLGVSARALARAGATRTLQLSIAKKSTPFVKLLRRLLSEA